MSGKKKLLAALLCLILAVACCLAAPAFAESEIYIEYAWDNDTEELTRAEKPIPEGAAQLDAETTGLAYDEENQGWFTAGGALTFDTRLTVTGDVRLILLDGCKLRANQGITVEGSSSLTIYAQSEDENTGALAAAGSANNAAIGGGNQGSGTITIHGGKIDATTVGSGAGIGGGCYGSGEVTIFGGTATAMASGAGAGIGGGVEGAGTAEISGGTVTATASGKGATIGNGQYVYGGSVTVTGGSVSAVHTAQSRLSIGGAECTVSLGLTEKNDSVYAAGYTAKDEKVTLTAALQDADKGEKFPDEGNVSPEEPTGIDADKLARKLLIPDTEEAARQQAWNDKAVTFRLPGSLGGIGSGAFQNIRAATVLVPQTVKKIGADAFRGSGVKRIKFENGNPEEFDASAFADCPFVIVYTPAQGKVYETMKDKANVYLMTR